MPGKNISSYQRKDGRKQASSKATSRVIFGDTRASPIATLTWILAYEEGNGKNTKAIKEALSILLSDDYKNKAPLLGYVPLRIDILEKSRAAVNRIGK